MQTVASTSERRLESIKEEGDNKRAKKVSDLLNKVKKVTAKSSAQDTQTPLAIIGQPQPPADTFITGGGIKNKDQVDEDLTDEALLRQYEELAAKD